jgi:hypothetical protein
MTRENRSWGYDRIVGALANLDDTISDQTVGNILKRHGLPPAPERQKTTTWKEFIRTHLDVLVATDFFEECLSRMMLFGEASLRHVLTQYVEHFYHERNHQGKGNVLLFPAVSQGTEQQGPMQCRERLGGLLKYYTRDAA